MSIYPILLPPEEFRGIGDPRTWSKKTAQRKFEWVMSVREQRIAAMLAFFSLSYPPPRDEPTILDRLGQLISRTITVPPYFREESEATVLTAPALSLAYDAGLLLGELIIRAGYPDVSWQLMKGSKDMVSFNLPVLASPHTRIHYDPIGRSLGSAEKILKSGEGSEFWMHAFDLWVIKLAPERA